MTLEPNKIYLGDSVKLMQKLEDKSVDHIITDPPYNVNKCDWDTNVLDLLDSVAKESGRVLKDDGLLFWFVPTKHLIKIGFLIGQYIPYRWSFVWHTPNNMCVGDIGFSKYTIILIFSRAKSVHKNMQDLKSIIQRPKNKSNNHPTPKPEELLRYIIKKTSKEQDLILDMFSGSGSTAVVCNQLNRRYLGFEINQEYINIANERLKQNTLLNIECIKA